MAISWGGFPGGGAVGEQVGNPPWSLGYALGYPSEDHYAKLRDRMGQLGDPSYMAKLYADALQNVLSSWGLSPGGGPDLGLAEKIYAWYNAVPEVGNLRKGVLASDVAGSEASPGSPAFGSLATQKMTPLYAGLRQDALSKAGTVSQLLYTLAAQAAGQSMNPLYDLYKGYLGIAMQQPQFIGAWPAGPSLPLNMGNAPGMSSLGGGGGGGGGGGSGLQSGTNPSGQFFNPWDPRLIERGFDPRGWEQQGPGGNWKYNPPAGGPTGSTTGVPMPDTPGWVG